MSASIKHRKLDIRHVERKGCRLTVAAATVTADRLLPTPAEPEMARKMRTATASLPLPPYRDAGHTRRGAATIQRAAGRERRDASRPAPERTPASGFLFFGTVSTGCVMGRLVHTGLGSSSLVAHVLHYPPPPTRTAL